MVFTERDLISIRPFHILDNSTYLTEEEIAIRPIMIPMIENKRLDTILIDQRYSDLIDLSEEYSVVIDEEEVILDPSILQETPNAVVRPISFWDSEYQFSRLCPSLTPSWRTRQHN